MTDLEKVARMALKTLEYIDLQDHDRDFLNYKECHDLDEAITALHQALSNSVEQPAQQQEPVGYFSVNDYGRWEENEGTYGQPLYDRPQAPVDWEAVAADQAMTIAMMKGAQEAAVLAEREALEKMDWTSLMRQGALVTWDDAETLGDRVIAAIRARGQA